MPDIKRTVVRVTATIDLVVGSECDYEEAQNFINNRLEDTIYDNAYMTVSDVKIKSKLVEDKFIVSDD